MSNISIYKDHCCGCGECAAICPKQAIAMVCNDQGFLYPQVDKKLCVQCDLCVNHCTFNNTQNVRTGFSQQSYAVKHKDSSVRASSRSGGIFTALSDWVLAKGGLVYGCKLENNRYATHCRASTHEVRNTFRGSKYIQSNTQHIFHNVKHDLKNGRWVLFSGTPCQTSAISDFCADINCQRLILVDIVCHGVPSPKVWQDYLNFYERKQKSKVSSVDFRNKKDFGWAAHKETIYFADGTSYSGESFKTLFYNHLILRDSCFACPYKTLTRESDITIADCWGIQEHHPDFDDNKGVSLVLINTVQGQQLYQQLQDIESISVDIQNLMQPCLMENWPKPMNYNEFWKFYRQKSFAKVLDKYVYHRPTVRARIVYSVRSTLARIYQKIVK